MTVDGEVIHRAAAAKRCWHPWKVSTRQDRLAFAGDWRDIAPPSMSLPGIDDTESGLARRITACRIAKMLAYAIPNFAAITPEMGILIPVAAQDAADFDAHTRDADAVAHLIGAGAVKFCDLNDPDAADALIAMVLLPRVTEDRQWFGFCFDRKQLLIGFGATRFGVCMQSLYAQFMGHGFTQQIDCTLGDSVVFHPGRGQSMRHAWTMGQFPSAYNAHGLISIEGQIDDSGITDGGEIHPLAGSVVTLGSHTVFVNHAGMVLDLASGQYGRCIASPTKGAFDLELFEQRLDGFVDQDLVEFIRMGAGPADDILTQNLRVRFGWTVPKDLSGTVVVADATPIGRDHAWYPHHNVMGAMTGSFDDDE